MRSNKLRNFISDTLIHINRPHYDAEWIRRQYCPTCKKRRTMFVSHQLWYGCYTTCLGCGECWADGEMCERPFRPRWRKENIESAKQRLKELRKTGNLLTPKQAIKAITDSISENF